MKLATLLLTLSAALLLSCNQREDKSGAQKSTPTVDTTAKYQPPPPRMVDSLSGIEKEDTVVFRAPGGKLYTVYSRKVDLLDTEPEESGGGGPHMMAAAAKNRPCQGERFDGSDRKAAKTSVATAPVENFPDLAALMATLQPDVKMGDQHQPPIKTVPTSNRVPEEKRNVHVQDAWVYTFTREADEDYHVIIGTSDTRSQAKFLNMEISGLPSSSASSLPRLRKARNDFESFFGLQGKCVSGYSKDFLNNPVKVEITGSLFFDKLHYDGKATIGPPEARAKSYWEIHPVTNITFQH